MQLPIWTQQKRFVSANSASRSERGFAGGGRGSGNTASFGALRLMSCCSSSFCRCSECAFLFIVNWAVFNEREASSVVCGGGVLNSLFAEGLPARSGVQFKRLPAANVGRARPSALTRAARRRAAYYQSGRHFRLSVGTPS